MTMATLTQHATLTDSLKPSATVERSLRLQCPECREPMAAIDPWREFSPQRCPSCDLVLASRHGIWHALAPAREERFKQFIEEYETVRRREGRGSGGSHYYLALPYRDVTGRNTWQWRIRRRTFRFFAGKILAHLEWRHPEGLDILDIGAGNCWMSYRLALRGHRPVAVDLLMNDHDGLGAARHYFGFLPRTFPRFQAEMDRLPFADRQFDLVIFNASFHYSEDYERTLAESLRCLRRPGHLFILDSPLYRREECGRQMVEERRLEFQKQHGFRSDSIPSQEFITPSALDALGLSLGLVWNIYTPWYGLGWALRPARAWLRGRREPARFQILWGTAE